MENNAGFDVWRVGNCVFECSVCDKRWACSVAFWDHVTEVHGAEFQSREEFAKAFPNYQRSSSFISCQICGQLITHDFTFVSQHMSQKHKMTTRQYYFSHLVDRNHPSRQVDNE
jgi:hypothetical protein